ncbi:MAG: lantibiotic dehydratase [Bacteroidota bacterium]|nr:lantibiotic dehydratase [Bacteroidota bacterium]
MQDFKSHLPKIVIIRNTLLPFNKYNDVPGNSTSDMFFKDALYVASSGLFAEIIKAIEKNIPLDKKLQKSLLKYHIRSCTRCTPYGLFAGLHTAIVSEQTTQVIIKNEPVAKLRLDMDYLVNVYHDLCKDEMLKKELIYYPNSSLYKIANKWRYHEFKTLNKRSGFHLVHIDDNTVLSKLIKFATIGISYSNCLQFITQFGFDEAEAKQYLNELVQGQVLINELYPNVSGEEYQTVLFEKLSTFVRYKKLPEEVNGILTSMESIITKTVRIQQLLKSYFSTAINESRFIQVDTLKQATKAIINYSIPKQILDAAELLNKLTPFDDSQTALTKFKKAFYERYEEDEVSLLEVLDTDIGINYKNAISETDYRSSNKNNMLWDVFAKFKLNLYVKAHKQNLHQIAIADEDVKAFKVPNHTLPDTFAFMGELLKEGDITKIVWTGISNNATRLTGRFGHLDESIKNLCINLAQQEEALQPDKVFAEIVHISEGRLGNILTRPHYRKYEIPYLAMSTLPVQNQIQVNDLMVSVNNDRVVLRSKRLNKEILPRMANAHNFAAMGLPIYHFLCDLQHQGIKGYLGWNGGFLGNETYLPRVTYKNHILCPAYWNIPSTKLKPLLKLKSEEQTLKFAEIKNELQLPEKAYLSEGDNELLLDFNNLLCFEILLDASKKSNQLKLTECLFTDDNLLVTDEKGNGYTNEIIIPFVKRNDESMKPKTGLVKSKSINKTSPKRNFEPYSEWVYYKIYTGTKTADKILIQHIDKITQTLSKEGVIKKWFFIRYADPKNHLRIRFLLSSSSSFNALNNLLQKILSPLVKNGLIWKIQIDTYQRELERYGHSSIELSEDYFHINSESVLSVLKAISTDETANTRFILGLLGVVKLYEAFGYTIQTALPLIEQGAKSFGNEFGIQRSEALRDKIKDDYRKLLPEIEKALNEKSEDQVYSKAMTQFNRQIKLCLPLLKQLQNTKHAKSIDELMPSYIHMFVNRFFTDNQRFHEMMIYQLLEKYYISKLARVKYNMGKNAN